MKPTAVTLDGVTKSFGDRAVLKEMSFAVKPGEIYGFVGANGSGKTTTMRIMLGVLEADSGRVLWGDRPMGAAERRATGYMPEERGLYPKEKVGEQLVYLGRLHGMSTAEAHRESREILGLMGLAEREGDKLEELSLGNQQRVQLAAALVHQPAFLVLDEPFSGLDPVAVRVMSEVLRERARAGVPVIFSSHQLELVSQLCDRVGIVHDGAIYAEGSVSELQSRGPRLVEVAGPAVAAPGAREELLAVPGVQRAVESSAESLTVELARDADDQVLLHAAVGHGAVHTFAPRPLPLTDLFQEVVTNEEEHDG